MGKIGAWFLGFVMTVLVIILIICTVKIPAGYVGVVYSMNGGVQEKVLSQGWHLVGIGKHVTKYTVGIEQSYLTKDDKGDSKKDEHFTASSSEGKAIDIDLTFTYQYDASSVADVFTKFKGQSGREVKDSFIKPNIISWTKEVVANYKVADILGAQRADINARLTEYLSNKFAPYGITISNVSLIDVSVDEETEQAISDKIKAQQQAERQAIENQTNIDKATAEAEAARIKAQGKADALLIKAQAEADANALLNQSLTENVIKKDWIAKWDGVLPKVQTNGNSIVDIGEMAQ